MRTRRPTSLPGESAALREIRRNLAGMQTTIDEVKAEIADLRRHMQDILDPPAGYEGTD